MDRWLCSLMPQVRSFIGPGCGLLLSPECLTHHTTYLRYPYERWKLCIEVARSFAWKYRPVPRPLLTELSIMFYHHEIDTSSLIAALSYCTVESLTTTSHNSYFLAYPLGNITPWFINCFHLFQQWGTGNGHVIGQTCYYDVIDFVFVAKRRDYDVIDFVFVAKRRRRAS